MLAVGWGRKARRQFRCLHSCVSVHLFSQAAQAAQALMRLAILSAANQPLFVQGWEEAASSFAVSPRPGWPAAAGMLLLASCCWYAPAGMQPPCCCRVAVAVVLPWCCRHAAAAMLLLPCRSSPHLPASHSICLAGRGSEAGQLVRGAAGGARRLLGRCAGRRQPVAPSPAAQPGSVGCQAEQADVLQWRFRAAAQPPSETGCPTSTSLVSTQLPSWLLPCTAAFIPTLLPLAVPTFSHLQLALALIVTRQAIHYKAAGLGRGSAGKNTGQKRGDGAWRASTQRGGQGDFCLGKQALMGAGAGRGGAARACELQDAFFGWEGGGYCHGCHEGGEAAM